MVASLANLFHPIKEPAVNEELYQIADELRAIANLGLNFCENGYDRERYEHILQASARLLAAVEGGLWRGNPGPIPGQPETFQSAPGG